jgi:hypothetical protein
MAVWKEKNVGRITVETDKNITVCFNNFMASLITEITRVYLFTLDQAKDIDSAYIQAFSLFPHFVMVEKITSRQ